MRYFAGSESFKITDAEEGQLTSHVMPHFGQNIRRPDIQHDVPRPWEGNTNDLTSSQQKVQTSDSIYSKPILRTDALLDIYDETIKQFLTRAPKI